MPYIMSVAYIAGAAIGFILFYLIIKYAVKDGIIAANKAMEVTKLEDRLSELKAKQDPKEKA